MVFVEIKKDIQLGLGIKKIKNIVFRILDFEHVKNGFVHITFTNDKKLKKINQQFLKHNSFTDVITFDLCDYKGKTKRSIINADIIISADRAQINSRYFGTKATEELVLYVIHGILHCLNYNDQTKQDFEKMQKRQEAILKKLKCIL